MCNDLTFCMVVVLMSSGSVETIHGRSSQENNHLAGGLGERHFVLDFGVRDLGSDA